MRLVFINRFFYPDGSATALMLADLVEGLAPLRLEMHVITGRATHTPGASETATDFPATRLSVTRLPHLGAGHQSIAGRLVNFAVFYAALIVAGMARIRRGDIVICLTDPPLVGIVAALLAQLKGAQLIHWVQDIYPETATRLGYGSPTHPAVRLATKLRDWAWRRASANVVIGERMGEFLRERAVPGPQVCVIPNWADEEALAPLPAEDNPLRAQWGFSTETIVVGYSGNLGRAHDAATMLGAAAIFAARPDPAVSFLFIGGGAKHALFASADADARLTGIITTRPYRPRSELRQSLAVPDIHWLSLEPELEGLIVPSKFYGAAAAGRPVIFIGDPRGEIAALIAEAECGASFAKGDAAGVAEYLQRLASDAQLRQRLGDNARDYCLAHLSRARRMAQWQSLIKAVAISDGFRGDRWAQ
jgi:glycosyltransferase involved in cell wall biosynthesis